MKAFIFAAGFGERLRPITESIPKPLVPVLNVPSICYSLIHLKKAGISNLIINLHYKKEEIIRFFENNGTFGFNIDFSIEETILGTGGGLKKCEHLLFNDDFVLQNSDVIMGLDIDTLIKRHTNHNSYGTIVFYNTPLARSIGSVSVFGDRVVDFKNYLNSGVTSDYIYTGAAVLSPRIFPFLSAEFSSIVYTGYTGMIQYHHLDYYEHNGIWEDIGSIESFRRANLNLLPVFRELQNEFWSLMHIKPEIISTNAKIHKDALVVRSVVGDGCVIGKGSVVIDSVLLAGSVVADGLRIVDAVVTTTGQVLKLGYQMQKGF